MTNFKNKKVSLDISDKNFVFKTSIETPDQAAVVAAELSDITGFGKWNFDLSDCDRIFRVESSNLNPAGIIKLFRSLGFQCSELL